MRTRAAGPSVWRSFVSQATAVSVASGYAVIKTGSLIPAIVSHYCINVLIWLLPADLSEAASAGVFGGLTIAYPILTIIAVWWLCRPRQTADPVSPIASRAAR